MITECWAGNKDWNDPCHWSVHPDNDDDDNDVGDDDNNDDDNNNDDRDNDDDDDDNEDDDNVDLFAKVTATASDPRTSAGERTGWNTKFISEYISEHEMKYISEH